MEITPHLLLNAYCQGIFPMAQDDGALDWYDPDPRAVLPLASFHVPRSLRRRMRKQDYEISINSTFREVMVQCAAPDKGRESTWISEALIDLYTEVHDMGYAHSVEIRMQGRLVGGVYGVSIGGFFAGESMFSRVTDGSKLALAALVCHLRARGFMLLDIQFMTDHLKRFGAREIPRSKYKTQLAEALAVETSFVV
ncbi:MAG: leucyl/phenylalanyl-tRNA--protein transferase [Planctomycetes bacterium]|nr:leucyl/phenylalanyl-tRNA--protein transferase [Planctomycetota bacterium]